MIKYPICKNCIKHTVCKHAMLNVDSIGELSNVINKIEFNTPFSVNISISCSEYIESIDNNNDSQK